jgi:antitoxin component YwqK of YwqJK toxin-antitoxin module
MKKIFIAGLLILCSALCGYSQVKTVYFDVKDKVTADSVHAASYAVYGKVSGDSLWVFKKYDMDGYIATTGSFKDSLLEVPQGRFVYYDWINPNKSTTGYEALNTGKDRYKVLSGDFENGLKQGRWLGYYENGLVKTLVTFDRGVMQGPFKAFDDKGELIETGQYVQNKKDGDWVINGGLRVVTFKMDEVVSDVKRTKKELKQLEESKKKGL